MSIYDECDERSNEDTCTFFGGIEFDPMARTYRTYAQCLREFEAELNRLAELTVASYRKSPESQFLHGKPRDGIYLQTTVAVECGDKWQVIVPEAVPQNLTVDQLREWFRERLKREPLAIFST